MNNTIKFGTDGWRDVIGDGFTNHNVALVTQATCEALKKLGKNRLILIGYDNRFMSSKFASLAAQVAMANDFKVQLASQSITSPVLSHQTKVRKAAIGIMITASHNPPEFNGFKLKGPWGGSVDEDLTGKVESELSNIETVRMGEKVPAAIDFIPSYLSWLRSHFSISALRRLRGRVVFDALHGPGGKIFQSLVGKDSRFVVIRDQVDPLFGQVHPEPIETNLSALKHAVLSQKAVAGIAVDGDGDRIGIVDEQGRYIPPHTVMPLLLLHLIENRKMKGGVVQTVSMGYLPGRIAAKYDIPFEQVAVGYKHIAAKIRAGKVLLGGEESGGFGVGLWSAERDGIVCALLLLEYLARTNRPLSNLIDNLYQKYGQSVFKRVDFALSNPVNKQEWTAQILPYAHQTIGSHKIKNLMSFDGLKVVLEDDSWLLMRPSGTEPLIRTYAESPSEKIVEELLGEAGKIIEISLLPKKNAATNAKKARAKTNKSK